MEQFRILRVYISFLVVILCAAAKVVAVGSPVKTNLISGPQIYDLCGQQYNGRRIYLEFGKSGLITARNVQLLPVPSYVEPTKINGEPLQIPEESIPQECRIELVACSTCVIKWGITESNFTKSESGCPTDGNSDYIELTEPPYGAGVSGTRICSANAHGKSQTRDVLLRFVFTRKYEFAFNMVIEIKRNRINITEVESHAAVREEDDQPIQQFISTPFFPLHYPRDYEVEYLLKCDECQVHVNFIDFQLAPVSVLEIVDFKSEKVEIYTGLSIRPRIFISSGNTLVFRFNANGGIGAGFRGIINFISPNQTTKPEWNPNTDCGGYVDRLGGAITMMKMTDNESEVRYFDCIWIIRPSNKYYHMKTHLSLQLASFSLLPNSQLTLHRGMNSFGEILSTFQEQRLDNNDIYEALVTDGFYVQLKGNFSMNSTLAIVYTVFSYSNCYMGSDVMCVNQKCIPVQVHCDGFDHCGDGSDEPPSCVSQWQNEPFDRQWYKNNPNYYFPAAEYDFKAASILFISTSAGLILLVACLFLVLYRINVKARHQRELQNHLQTISELLDQNSHSQFVPEDDPPIYEAPPEYEEVINVGMDKEIRRSRRINREERRRRRSRQPILEPEPDDGQATPALTNRHAILTEQFPVEAGASTSQTAETETEQDVNVHETADSKHDVIEELNEENWGKHTSNGFLIVFQNDEPTAVPVHEFIPFDNRIKNTNTCYQCENHQSRENEFANRIVRRFSADPQPTSMNSDFTRSFRV